MEILDAVQRSADRFNHPGNRYGYGIPNFETAYSILAAKRLEKANSMLKDKWIVAYPVPFGQQFTVVLKAPASGSSTIRLLDANGKILTEKTLQVKEGSHYNVPMYVPLLRKSVYYVQYSDGANNATLRIVNLWRQQQTRCRPDRCSHQISVFPPIAMHTYSADDPLPLHFLL